MKLTGPVHCRQAGKGHLSPQRRRCQQRLPAASPASRSALAATDTEFPPRLMRLSLCADGLQRLRQLAQAGCRGVATPSGQGCAAAEQQAWHLAVTYSSSGAAARPHPVWERAGERTTFYICSGSVRAATHGHEQRKVSGDCGCRATI